jgi:hypothetical protein
MNHIKHEELDLDNAGHIKIGLLREGVTIKPAILEHVHRRYREKRRAYAGSDDLASKGLAIPQEIVLPGEYGEVIVDVHHRVNSPWQVDLDNHKEPTLFYHGQRICPVIIPARAKYYGHPINGGKPSERIGSMYGVYVLAFFLHGHCVMFDYNLQCGFCSLKPTREDFDDVDMAIREEDAVAVTQLAFSMGDDIRYAMLCDGNYASNDYGFERSLEIAAAIKPYLPAEVILHLLVMPPDDLLLLARMPECGIDTVSFSMDIFDPQRFMEICPGKANLYGHEKIHQALREAAQYLPYGNTYCTIVGGLDDIDTLCRGFDELAAEDIAPTVNIFHADPKAKMHDHPPPDTGYLLRMARHLAELYRSYRFRSVIGYCTRNSINGEAVRGYFD